ncbi:hypothetical protein FAZ19_19860 [Sphingobacterium alkalisoli]|uniref:Uncharacterized protein n=1 Tax=Sphingobacterium alkalisoli TaxID=1874115 RepID=A0A4U0GUY9_9SPHI|nr:hypothetical protein [Sphingobacterium alkalisoli]TJY62726.1 hypothetical protein FAZ19_19860 [Sphingobacterium alkalisoli]GGH28486.1 hypothetical protein GCM10011418_39180 [Sphingobacterium alkalisoli]
MSDPVKELEQKAEQEAYQHTVFMALADIYNQLNPNVEIGEYLKQLQDNKAAEKNRIMNEIIRMKRPL